MVNLIAPCGMNCSLCMAFQRSRNKCNGCNDLEKKRSNHCDECRIKNCEELLGLKSNYCYSCGSFPCKRILQLDKRYRTKYGMSMMQNLKDIETKGIKNFIESEKVKWSCMKCGSLLCVHRAGCQKCGNINDKYPGNT